MQVAKTWAKNIGVYVLLIVVALVMAAPFLWMLISSFKPDRELFAYPPVWLPTHVTFEHYVRAFEAAAFPRYFGNSFMVAGLSTAANLFFCSLAGYAFARLHFWRKELLFFVLLGTMMIPVHATLVPTFILAKSFPLMGGNDWLGVGGRGLMNTYPGLMLPHLMNVFGVFLLRQFFLSLPEELFDAARIDGANEFSIYRRICLPLSRPVMATLAIFSFTGAWDDFIWPLVITTQDKMRTVQLGLQAFQTQFTVDWGPLMAATLVVTAPVLLIFIFGQRHFVQGVATTGLKG